MRLKRVEAYNAFNNIIWDNPTSICECDLREGHAETDRDGAG
jgi:hypothetical protein